MGAEGQAPVNVQVIEADIVELRQWMVGVADCSKSNQPVTKEMTG